MKVKWSGVKQHVQGQANKWKWNDQELNNMFREKLINESEMIRSQNNIFREKLTNESESLKRVMKSTVYLVFSSNNQYTKLHIN